MTKGRRGNGLGGSKGLEWSISGTDAPSRRGLHRFGDRRSQAVRAGHPGQHRPLQDVGEGAGPEVERDSDDRAGPRSGQNRAGSGPI